MQHHKKQESEVSPDKEKNITHLQKIYKNYKIQPVYIELDPEIENSLTHYKWIAVIMFKRQSCAAYNTL